MKYLSHSPLLFILLLLVGCAPKEDNEYGSETGKVETKADPVHVEGLLAVLGDFPIEFVSNGKLEAAKQAELYFNKRSIVQKIHVQNGAWVEEGTVLATLENSVEELNLRQAEYQVESAQIEMEDRLLTHSGGTGQTGRTSEKAKDYFELSSGLKNARLSLEKAQIDYDLTILKAPFSGRMADLTTKPMNIPDASVPFCRILDDRNFEVLFPVLESEVSRLSVNQNISMRPFMKDSVLYSGRITEINPVVDEHGLVRIRALVPNRDRNLIQGMNVKVFVKDKVPNSLIVPKEAVVLRNNRQVVFTYSEGKAMWNYIMTILENSASYSITKEPGGSQIINPGDTVITIGNLNLAHEAEVRFKMVKD